MDGQAGLGYDELAGTSAGQVIFSPDSRHVVYIAGKGGSYHLVIDGREEGPPCGGIANDSISFSLVGDHVAYVGMTNHKYFVVRDGEKGPDYDMVHTLVFSSDGKHLAYAARLGQKWFLVVDGKTGPEYDSIYPETVVCNADGSVGYLAFKNGRVFPAGLYHVTQPIK